MRTIRQVVSDPDLDAADGLAVGAFHGLGFSMAAGWGVAHIALQEHEGRNRHQHHQA